LCPLHNRKKKINKLFQKKNSVSGASLCLPSEIVQIPPFLPVFPHSPRRSLPEIPRLISHFRYRREPKKKKDTAKNQKEKKIESALGKRSRRITVLKKIRVEHNKTLSIMRGGGGNKTCAQQALLA
jgi:hypothetical protein